MKWYWKLLIGFVFVLLLGFYSVDYFATSILKGQAEVLKKQVADDYIFKFKDLDLSLINRKIVLREFEFYTVVDSFSKENKYDCKIDKLTLKYAKYFDLLLKRSVDIIEVVLREPQIKYGLNDYKKEPEKEKTVEIKDSTGVSFFQIITLEKFRIESGKVDFYNLNDPEEKIVFVNDLDVNIDGFVIDLVKDSMYITQTSEKPLFSFKEVSKTDLKKHNLSIDEIQYYFHSKDLKITNLKFENKDSPQVFRQTLSHRSPWFSINVPEIVVNIDPRHIYDHGIFHLPKIEIDQADVLISNDLNFPIKPGHKPMPGRQIKGINLNFLIDSIKINNSQLVYTHKAEAAEEGFLKFSNLDALVLRATDIDSIIAANPFLDIKVNSTFWDMGNLNVNFRIDLSSSIDRIDVSGSLNNLPFEKVENMTKPLYGIEVKSGHIDRLAFNFAMDENFGKGKMQFDYSDLILDVKAQDKVEKKQGNETQYTDKSVGIFNFAVNEAVKTNNIPGDPNYKTEGAIIVDRTKIKPVFDLLWNCLANGMMDIALKDIYFNSEKNYLKKQKKEEKQRKKEERKATKKSDEFTEKGGIFKKKKKE